MDFTFWREVDGGKRGAGSGWRQRERKSVGGEIERKLECGSILKRYIYHFIIASSFCKFRSISCEELSVWRVALKIWWRSSLSMRRLYKCRQCQQRFSILEYHMDFQTMLLLAKALNSSREITVCGIPARSSRWGHWVHVRCIFSEHHIVVFFCK